MKILLIDDNEDIRKQIKWFLKNDYTIYEAETKNDAEEILLKKNSIDLIILDLFLPPKPTLPEIGFMLLQHIRKKLKKIPVIVITGGNEKELAIKAIESGATDFFHKPINLDELNIVIKRTLYRKQLEDENIYLKESLSKKYNSSNIIYTSESMKKVIEYVKQIIDSELPVLIEGESGTGKELIAKAIHYNSKQSGRLMAINCSAIPENLLESELFGYVKGAFTGATSNKKGKIELADNGTLFLDEIGDMPLSMQAKILRVLADGVFTPVGSNTLKKSKFKLISATNKNLENLIKKGLFREDLFYRINVIRIKIPPLHKRKEDIPYLIHHFIELYNKKNKTEIKNVSEGLMEKLINKRYKGNVRELENLIYLGCAVCKEGIITEKDLKIENISNDNYLKTEGKTLKEITQNFERTILIKTLNEVGWVYIKAAKKLGMDKYKMQYLTKKYGIKKSNKKVDKK